MELIEGFIIRLGTNYFQAIKFIYGNPIYVKSLDDFLDLFSTA